MLEERGAKVEHVFCCGNVAKSPKPAGGMLRDAMKSFGASAQETFFIGDQKADLQAAFHAKYRGIIAHGHGRENPCHGLPAYLKPVEAADDLAAAVKIVWRPDFGLHRRRNQPPSRAAVSGTPRIS